MNDEQIRDSFTNLAASAPTTDLWLHVRNQIGSQKPNRSFWPSFKLRPLLVALNASAIAVLLLLVFNFTNPFTQPPQSTTITPLAANSSASPCDARQFCVVWNEGAPGANPPISHTFTLTDFVAYMGNDPTFLLPALANTSYHLTSDISTGIHSFQIIGSDGEPTQASEPARDRWSVSYRNDSNPADLRNVTLMAQVNLGYTGVISSRDKEDLTIHFQPQTLTRPIAEYHRTDRIIQIFHQQNESPPSQGATIYFLNPQNGHKVLTVYTLTGSYNVPDDDLLRLADSIERVDPNHLERYQ